jgi:hypothetical protein
MPAHAGVPSSPIATRRSHSRHTSPAFRVAAEAMARINRYHTDPKLFEYDDDDDDDDEDDGDDEMGIAE